MQQTNWYGRALWKISNENQSPSIKWNNGAQHLKLLLSVLLLFENVTVYNENRETETTTKNVIMKINEIETKRTHWNIFYAH